MIAQFEHAQNVEHGQNLIPNVWYCSKRLIVGRAKGKMAEKFKISSEDLIKLQKLGGIMFRVDFKGRPERF